MAKLPRLRRKDSKPAKQVTGTTYSSSGAVSPDPINYKELGSSRAPEIRDIVPELGTRPRRVQTYRKMVRTDVSVRTSLRAGKAPVLGATYFVEPFSQDPDHLAQAEFVEFNLFKGMSTPWLTVLNQICRNYEDGTSVFETNWELREWAPKKTSSTANRRKYTMLRKLTMLPLSTISDFKYDDTGGPTSIVQRALREDGKTEEVEIDIGKLIVFPFDQSDGSLEGESILRSAYESWFYKYHLYKIDAIQKERHGIGVPDIELAPGYSEKDLQWAHELGRNLRTNEYAHIVRTTLLKVGFAQLEGQPVDALKSAIHHDNQIMKNILVQFLNLGVEGGGGRATGATGMDMFLKSMRFVANSICDSYNLFVIPRLIAYNFQTDQFPLLKAKNIGEAKDLQMFASAMGTLVKNGIITMDIETENWARSNMDAPLKPGDRPQDAPNADTIPGVGQNVNRGSGNVGLSPSSGAV